LSVFGPNEVLHQREQLFPLPLVPARPGLLLVERAVVTVGVLGRRRRRVH
jgi:hypothetical protein